MDEPPLEAGGEKLTDTWALPAVAVPMTGALGTVAGVTLTAADAAPVPMALLAVTVQAAVVPLASPVTTSGEPVPAALCEPQVAV